MMIKGKLPSIQGMLTSALVVLSISQSFYLVSYVRDQRATLDYVNCQAQLTEATRLATNVSRRIATEDRATLRNYFIKAGKAFKMGDVKGQQVALDEFFANQAKADADRDSNPIPDWKC